ATTNQTPRLPCLTQLQPWSNHLRHSHPPLFLPPRRLPLGQARNPCALQPWSNHLRHSHPPLFLPPRRFPLVQARNPCAITQSAKRVSMPLGFYAVKRALLGSALRSHNASPVNQI